MNFRTRTIPIADPVTHFRPHADFMAELEAHNAKRIQPQPDDTACVADLKRAGLFAVPLTPAQHKQYMAIKRKHYPIQLGDTVIVPDGRDGVVDYVEPDGRFQVRFSERGCEDFDPSEIELE